MMGDGRARQPGAVLVPGQAVSQEDGGPGCQACQVCRRPLPSQHRHVLDAERCAVFCTCPGCWTLLTPADGPGWLGKPAKDRRGAAR